MKKKETPKKFILQNFVWLAGVVMAILNLWLASRLAPLSESIIVINQKVEAIENNANTCVTRNEFVLIGERLDRIQTSLNDLVKLHLKQ